MATEIKLPQLAEGVDSADIADVYVSEGDVVEAGQDIVNLDMDKTSAPFPTDVAGKVAKVHIKEGDTVSVGDVLITVEETVGASTASEAAPAPEPIAVAAESQASAPVKNDAPQRQVALNDRGGDFPPPASPSVRRMARKMGVALSQIRGSGRGGRITMDDVLALSGQSNTMIPSTGMIAAPPPVDFARFGIVERSAMNKIAKMSAQRLSYAWQTIPHVTNHDQVDVTDIETARRAFGTTRKDAPKLTMTAILVKACVAALKAFPKFNSSLDEAANELVYKSYYHVGIAVDTDMGLVVPVIRDADQKSILQIAEELTDLANRAREGKLSLDEMQGGTFTITNLGGIGGVSFTPIVNWPEVAILGVSRTQHHPRVIDGELFERQMLPLSLSYDHRVINGADAARFMAKLNQMLSDPLGLLVEA